MPCDCPACKRDNILNGTLTGECNYCHSKLDAHSSFQIMGDKSLVCDKCVTEHYIKCYCCDKLYNKSEAKEITCIDRATGNPITKNVCFRCFTVNYRECNGCHKFFSRQDILAHKENVYCRPFFDKSFQICAMCNSIYPKGSVLHIVREKYPACDKCYSYYGPIKVYETKPKLEFQGRPPHYYGVELEVELQNHERNERGLKAKRLLICLKDLPL